MFSIELGERLNLFVDEAIDIFGFEIEPDTEEIWEVARGSAEPPIFENVFLLLFFNKLAHKLWEIDESIQFDWDINAIASYFYYRFNESEDFRELTNLEEFVEMLRNENKEI